MHTPPSRVASKLSKRSVMAVSEMLFLLVLELPELMLRGVVLWSVSLHTAILLSKLTVAQVAIKTMKKTYDSFAPCLELREVIFLRTLPTHVHLVPALDIFLDPYTRKLHICMEYMDGNLYQLMKAR